MRNDWKEENRQTLEITTDKGKLPLSVNGIMGIGYDISKKDFLSAEVSYNTIKREQNRKTITESERDDSYALPGTSFRDYSTYSRTPTVSLMYTHKFDNTSELTVTGDYSGSYSEDDIVTGTIISDDTKKNEAIVNTQNNTSSFVGYANYSKKFNKKHNLNAGLQYSYIKNEAINNENSFAYNESVLRPFTSYSVNFNKFGIRAGVQAMWADIDDSNYIDVVPNISFNYYINREKGHILGAGYSMNVKRPTISQLNPDYYLSEKDIYVRVGNPDLSSYLTNSCNLSLRLFNDFSLLASYSRADDAITSYMYSDEEGTIYQTYTNDAKSQGVSVFFSYNKYLFKMLSVDLSTSYMFSENSVKGESNIVNSLSYAFALSLNMPKFYSISVWATGNTSSRVSFNATTKLPLLVNMTFSKRVKRWRLEFAVQDLLNTRKGNNVIIDMGNYIRKVSSNTSSRSYQIKASYNFNWGKAGRAKKSETQKDKIMERIVKE